MKGTGPRGVVTLRLIHVKLTTGSEIARSKAISITPRRAPTMRPSACYTSTVRCLTAGAVLPIDNDCAGDRRQTSPFKNHSAGRPRENYDLIWG
ncbi:hypothetical protein C0Z19_14795 [Trinickia soli]|jgi:hypothetical protein|uniref:Uncharacterized protein n=1 Tax=Trinickia soli TaxID=380675 RepID=A0A2N7W3W6_9BURK|nr:hypothetical protein CIW54_08005 [Paraburkholderia sp. T12-10]PMS24089.1 hypothetical protein C0Z19_14795 [Trinickia soli]